LVILNQKNSYEISPNTAYERTHKYVNTHIKQTTYTHRRFRHAATWCAHRHRWHECSVVAQRCKKGLQRVGSQDRSGFLQVKGLRQRAGLRAVYVCSSAYACVLHRVYMCVSCVLCFKHAYSFSRVYSFVYIYIYIYIYICMYIYVYKYMRDTRIRAHKTS
jgi:hypothetical protein